MGKALIPERALPLRPQLRSFLVWITVMNLTSGLCGMGWKRRMMTSSFTRRLPLLSLKARRVAVKLKKWLIDLTSMNSRPMVLVPLKVSGM